MREGGTYDASGCAYEESKGSFLAGLSGKISLAALHASESEGAKEGKRTEKPESVSCVCRGV